MKPLFDPTNPLIQSLVDRSAKIKPVRALWQQLVGEAAASHSEPVDLDRGILTVWVDSSLWATKLRHQGPSIVTKLNSHQRGLRVDSLSVRVIPSSIETNNKHQSHHHADQQTADLLSSVARSLDDAALRTSMARLSQALKDPSAKTPSTKKPQNS